MSVHNSDIANRFYRLAEFLEIEGANAFRVRAYRNAARTIESLPQSVAEMISHGADLSELPGIGKDLAGKIKEIVETGHFHLLEEEERKLPTSLLEMSTIPGLGPKRIKLLYDELKIRSREDLAKAAAADKLERLPGFGRKLSEKIGEALRRQSVAPKRLKLAAAEEIGESLLGYLKATKGVEEAEIAGSYRRRKETIGDIDIVVASEDASEVMARFVSYAEVAKVIAEGSTRSTVLLHSGLQVDLRVVPKSSYGAVLLYFTGSKAHNITLRAMAAKRGLKINEYGVFKGTKQLPTRSEQEIYRLLGLSYIEPELREDSGEIEAARKHRLPALVSLRDIRGDLHSHTKATDGRDTIAAMAKAAKERGYDYLAISDHTRHLTVAHGLDKQRLARQIAEINRINESQRGFRVLKSAEVDILEDGTLDLPDSILEKLDFTICAVHSKLGLPRDKQTARILRAMENPCCNVLAHPTGRLINEREPSDIDMERIMRSARGHGCFLEINAQPDRLDLNDNHARMAKDMGVKVAIATDAHSAAQLEYMRHGVNQARRGWLEADDILNTRSWPELSRVFRRR